MKKEIIWEILLENGFSSAVSNGTAEVELSEVYVITYTSEDNFKVSTDTLKLSGDKENLIYEILLIEKNEGCYEHPSLKSDMNRRGWR